MPAIANLPSRGESTAQTGDPRPIAAVIADVLARYGLEGTVPARKPRTAIRKSHMRGNRRKAPAVA
jgi:hypothetical protein